MTLGLGLGLGLTLLGRVAQVAWVRDRIRVKG